MAKLTRQRRLSDRDLDGEFGARLRYGFIDFQDSGIVDPKELVKPCDFSDFFCAFLRILSSPKTHKRRSLPLALLLSALSLPRSQSCAKRRKTSFWNTALRSDKRVWFIRRRVNAGICDQSAAAVNTACVANLCDKPWDERGANTLHFHNNRIFRQTACQLLHLCF